MAFSVVVRVLCLQALVTAAKISSDTNNENPLTEEENPQPDCDPVWINQGGAAVFLCVKKVVYYTPDGQEQTKLLDVSQNFQELDGVPLNVLELDKVPQDFQALNKVPQDFQELNKDVGDSQGVTEVPGDASVHKEPERSLVIDTLLRAQPFTVFNLGLLVTALCVMVAVLQYTMARYKTSTWHRLGFPGPTCSSILGNYWEIMMEGSLRRCVKRWHVLYGDIFGIHLGLSPVLVISDTSLIAGVLENESGCFTNRSELTAALNCPSLKFSLYNIKDSRWLTMRYNLSFLFNEENLDYMLRHLNPCAGRLANYLNKELQRTDTVSLKEFVTSYEYDVIASMLFGLKLDHHFDSNSDPFFRCMTSAFKTVPAEYEGVSVPSDMKMLFGYVQCAVHNRSEHRNVREAGDYLDLLLRRGASLSPVTLPPYELSWPEVYGNLLLWILHSHQTMISTLQFVIYMLAHNPEYQTMAFDEMKFTLGKDNLTYNDLQQLAVLDSVILETLRLFSPVQEIWRRSSSETRIFGTAFPKDVDILIPVDLVHSSDSNFSHPDDFKPERWGLGTSGQLPHPAFLAFGYGPRACIASDLVLLQLKVALVHCMRLVEFDVARQDPLPPNQHLEVKLGLGVTTEGILRPATSVKVRLILRGPGLPPPPPTQQIPMSVLPPFGAASLQPSPAPPQPSPVFLAPKVIQKPQETPPSFKPPISAQLIETDKGVQPVKTRYLTSTLPASLDPDARRERKWKEDKQLTSRWPKDAIVSEVDTKEVGKQMLPSLASRALMVKQATSGHTPPLIPTRMPRAKDTTPQQPHSKLPMSYLPCSVDSNLLVAPYEGGEEEHPLFREFRDVQDMAQHLLEELDSVRPGETRPEPGLLLPRETESARSSSDHLFLDIDISRQTLEVKSESSLHQSLSFYFSAIDLSDESPAALAEAEITRTCDCQASEYQTLESLLLENLNALYNRLKCLGSHLVITLHISVEPEEGQDGFESHSLAYPLQGPQTAGVDTRLPFTSRAASQIPWQAITKTKKVQATPNEEQAKNKEIIMQVGVPRSGLEPVHTQILDKITEAAQDVSQPFQSALSIGGTPPSGKSMPDATHPSLRMPGADDSQRVGKSMADGTHPSLRMPGASDSQLSGKSMADATHPSLRMPGASDSQLSGKSMADATHPSLRMPGASDSQLSGKSMADATHPSGRLPGADDSKPSEGMSMATATQSSHKWHVDKPRATDRALLVQLLKESQIRGGSSAEDLAAPWDKGTSGYFKRPWGRASGKQDHWPPLRKPEIPERFRSNIRFPDTQVQTDRGASTSSSASLTTKAERGRSNSIVESLYSFVQQSSILSPKLATKARERSESVAQSVYDAVRRSSKLAPKLATKARERSESVAKSVYGAVRRSSKLAPTLQQMATTLPKKIGLSRRADQFKAKESSQDKFEDHEELTEEESPPDEEDTISNESTPDDLAETKEKEISSDDLDETIKEENIQVDNKDAKEKEIPSDDFDETIKEDSPMADIKGPEDDAKKEKSPKDDAKKEKSPKDDAKKEKSPKDDAKKEKKRLKDIAKEGKGPEDGGKKENILADNEEAKEKDIPSEDFGETINEDSPLADIKGPEDDAKKEKSPKDDAKKGKSPKDDAKKEKSPKDGAKKEKSPKDDAKKEKSPKDDAKKEKSPKDGAKKENIQVEKEDSREKEIPSDDLGETIKEDTPIADIKGPEDDAKKEKSPKDDAKKKKSPKDDAKKEKSPKDDAKKEKSPKDGAKKEKSPKDDAKKEKSPKDDAKKEKSPKDDAKKEKSPKDDAKKEKSPKDGAKKEKSPKDDAKKEKSPKDDAKKEKSPKDDAKKEKSPKDDAKKEKSPKDGAKKEKSPKDDAKKEKSPKDDAKKEKSPKDDAKKEKSPKDDAIKKKEPKDGAKKKKKH